MRRCSNRSCRILIPHRPQQGRLGGRLAVDPRIEVRRALGDAHAVVLGLGLAARAVVVEAEVLNKLRLQFFELLMQLIAAQWFPPPIVLSHFTYGCPPRLLALFKPRPVMLTTKDCSLAAIQ